VDYASDETKKIGEEFIQKELAKITNEGLKNSIAKNLIEIEKGNRDFRY
jgi:2-iminoacetate synthase